MFTNVTTTLIMTDKVYKEFFSPEKFLMDLSSHHCTPTAQATTHLIVMVDKILSVLSSS